MDKKQKIKESKTYTLNIPEPKGKLKPNQEKMKRIEMSKQELLKLIGSLIYIIYGIATCIALGFNAHGLCNILMKINFKFFIKKEKLGTKLKTYAQ